MMFFYLYLLLFMSFSSINATNTIKVGIVGGGAAGLCAAYLLEDKYQVTVFEREEHLGGHARTINVKLDGDTCPTDIGFEFFSDSMHPTLWKLLSHLKVKIKDFPLTYSFATDYETIKLPPWVNGEKNFDGIIPPNLSTLLLFRLALEMGGSIVYNKNKQITIQEYCGQSWIPSFFWEDFFLPMMAALWMISLDDVRKCSAYVFFAWFTKFKPAENDAYLLYEIEGGTKVYIDVLERQLTNTKIRLRANIEDIIYEKGLYKIKLDGADVHIFDHLIIATGAHDAVRLLSSVPETQLVRSHLEKMEYHPITMAIHGDTSYLPKDHKDLCMMNVRHKAAGVCSTVCKPWQNPTNKPLYKTCISNIKNCLDPAPLYKKEIFYHPLPTPQYFNAQEQIDQFQGKNNLWFVGMHIDDTDSHESALQSAVKLGHKLNPESERLKVLQTNAEH